MFDQSRKKLMGFVKGKKFTATVRFQEKGIIQPKKGNKKKRAVRYMHSMQMHHIFHALLQQGKTRHVMCTFT